MSFAELSPSFTTGSVADADVTGDHTGQVIAVIGVNRLPRPLRKPLLFALASLTPYVWRGKTFRRDGTGTNLWLTPRHPRKFGGFSFVAGHDAGAAALNYDVSANPAMLRTITGELTTLAPGLLLGRMHLTRNARTITLMYFTLSR